MTIQALRERRSAISRELNNLMDGTQNAAWTPEHQVKYDNGMKEIENIESDIARRQKVLDLDAERSFENKANELAKDGQVKGEVGAVAAFLRGGISNLSDEQRKAMNARQNADIRNAMSTTTASEGGYTVAQEWMKQLEIALLAFGGMRSVATILPTATGAQLNFPTANSTTEVGEIVGQNTAVTNLDTVFGTASLGAYKYSSKSIALPWELLQDTFLNLDEYILGVLAGRIGRLQNTHFTTGSGSGQPTGIVTASGVGVTAATGGASTVSYDNLVDLEHSVDPAYRSNAGVSFMFADSTLKAVRKLKDSQGRPIFVPGYEQGNPGGAPDRILNRPIVINQAMPAMAANAKSIAFGDFKKYVIRQVQDLTLFRMTDSAFTLKGQVGFVGFQRADGNLIDVGGAVKLYQNSAT